MTSHDDPITEIFQKKETKNRGFFFISKEKRVFSPQKISSPISHGRVKNFLACLFSPVNRNRGRGFRACAFVFDRIPEDVLIRCSCFSFFFYISLRFAPLTLIWTGWTSSLKRRSQKRTLVSMKARLSPFSRPWEYVLYPRLDDGKTDGDVTSFRCRMGDKAKFNRGGRKNIYAICKGEWA